MLSYSPMFESSFPFPIVICIHIYQLSWAIGSRNCMSDLYLYPLRYLVQSRFSMFEKYVQYCWNESVKKSARCWWWEWRTNPHPPRHLPPSLGTHLLRSSFKRERCFACKVKTQSDQVISERIQPYYLLCQQQRWVGTLILLLASFLLWERLFLRGRHAKQMIQRQVNVIRSLLNF